MVLRRRNQRTLVSPTRELAGQKRRKGREKGRENKKKKRKISLKNLS